MKVGWPDLISIDHGDHEGIDDRSAEFLQQVRSQSRMTLAHLVINAERGIEAAGVKIRHDVVEGKRVGEAEQAIHRIGRGSAIAMSEFQLGTQTLAESAIICGRAVPLDAAQLLQADS